MPPKRKGKRRAIAKSVAATKRSAEPDPQPSETGGEEEPTVSTMFVIVPEISLLLTLSSLQCFKQPRKQ